MRARIPLVGAAAAFVLTAAACGSGGNSNGGGANGGGANGGGAGTTATAGPASATTAPFTGFGQAAGVRCLPVPRSGLPLPSWVPGDLALPAGTVVVDDPADQGGYHRATLAVPQRLHDLVTFVLERWPTTGWRLGRGDAENGEAEDSFVRGQDAGGFRARSVYCRADWTEFYLVMRIPGAAPVGAAVPGQAPSQPGGGPLITATTR